MENFCKSGFRKHGRGDFECVCGVRSTEPRSVGIKRKTSRHACPLEPDLLFNRRVLIVCEPRSGFKSSKSAPDFVNDLHGIEGFGQRLKWVVDTYIEASSCIKYLEVVILRFDNKSHLAQRLKELAEVHAFYETLFIFSGHGNTDGQLVINYQDETLPDTEIAAESSELICTVMRFYRPSDALREQRIPLIYLAFCHSDEGCGFFNQLRSSGLVGTIVITSVDSLPALELYSQCGMWMVRTLRSYSIPSCVSNLLLSMNGISGLPNHRIFTWDRSDDQVVLREVTTRITSYDPHLPKLRADIRTWESFKDCDGSKSLKPHTYLSLICHTDGMPNQ